MPTTMFYEISNPPLGGVTRLDVMDAETTREDALPIDWEQVHEAVQETLAPIATTVCHQAPHLRCRAGKTGGRVFFLFSYLTFDVPGDHAIDPVVVGLSFEPSPQGVRIRGDISGEETGRVYYETVERTVAAAPGAVLPAARETASRLHQQSAVVIDNLVQPSFPADD